MQLTASSILKTLVWPSGLGLSLLSLLAVTAPSASPPALSILRGSVCESSMQRMLYRIICLPLEHPKWSLFWDCTSLCTISSGTAGEQEWDCFFQGLVALRRLLLCWAAQLQGNKSVWTPRSFSLWSYQPWGCWDLSKIHSSWSTPWLYGTMASWLQPPHLIMLTNWSSSAFNTNHSF